MQKTWPTILGTTRCGLTSPASSCCALQGCHYLCCHLQKSGGGEWGGKKLNNLIRNCHCASHWTTKASQIGCQAKWQRSSRRGSNGRQKEEQEEEEAGEKCGKRVAAGVGVAYFAHVAAVTDACSNLQQVGSEGSTKRSDSCSRWD